MRQFISNIKILLNSCLIALLSIYISTHLTACSHNANETIENQKPPEVKESHVIFPKNSKQLEAFTTEVTALQTEDEIKVHGRVVLDDRYTAQIYSPFDGRIEKLLVGIGDPIEKGQALAKINSSELGSIKSELSKSEAELHLSQKNHQRAVILFDQGLIAKKELETLETELQKAQAEFNRNQTKMRAYAVNRQPDQTGILAAPISGYVVDMKANIGTEVRAENNQNGLPALFTISNTKKLVAILEAPENEAYRIQAGQTIYLWGTHQEHNAIVSKIKVIHDVIDPLSRTVKIRAEIENPNGLFRAEQFINGKIKIPSNPGMLVPASSVLLSPGGAIAYLQTDKYRFERRPITVETAGFQKTRIISGIQSGEIIVTEGALYLEQLFSGANKK